MQVYNGGRALPISFALLAILVCVGTVSALQPEKPKKPTINELLEIDACPLGYYRNAASDCTPCPAGSYCFDEQRIKCPESQIQPQRGRVACFDCPVGTHSDSFRVTCIPDAMEPPSSCPPGQYMNSVSWVCEPCPIGHACPDLSIDAVRCDYATEYQDESGSEKCKQCLPGELVSNTRTFCIPPEDSPSEGCIPGYFADKTGTHCMPCLTGHYCPGDNMLYRCDGEEDSYQPNMKSLHCEKCPRGTVVNNARTVCLSAERLRELERIARRMNAKEQEAIRAFERKQGSLRGSKKGSLTGGKLTGGNTTDVNQPSRIKMTMTNDEKQMFNSVRTSQEDPIDRARDILHEHQADKSNKVEEEHVEEVDMNMDDFKVVLTRMPVIEEEDIVEEEEVENVEQVEVGSESDDVEVPEVEEAAEKIDL